MWCRRLRCRLRAACRCERTTCPPTDRGDAYCRWLLRRLCVSCARQPHKGSDVQLQQRIYTAQQAMQAGRMDEAARLWTQVLELAPEHPQALFHLAQYRLVQKDPAGAILLLDRAAKAEPSAPAIPLNLSFVHRARADCPAELAALAPALALDPYYLPALLG